MPNINPLENKVKLLAQMCETIADRMERVSKCGNHEQVEAYALVLEKHKQEVIECLKRLEWIRVASDLGHRHKPRPEGLDQQA